MKGRRFTRPRLFFPSRMFEVERFTEAWLNRCCEQRKDKMVQPHYALLLPLPLLGVTVRCVPTTIL